MFDGFEERRTEVFLGRQQNEEMMYDNPRDVYREYGEEYLKEVFLRHYNLFNDVNRVFWKTILGISDEEIEEKTKGSFRNACKIWNY